ncbi:MAG: MFS transporter [Pirellulaceae bacterium]
MTASPTRSNGAGRSDTADSARRAACLVSGPWLRHNARMQDRHSPPAPDGPDDSPPSLYRDPSFWGMSVTQFLGAFNDNLFKQLMLLLAVPVAGSSVKVDQQGLATALFALPFILFSGLAGFLSDRFSKRPIIVWSKMAEIVVMGLGVVAFLGFGQTGFAGLLVVLFLMGTQSTFFGPGKYGILPEMLREADLPRANGFILMTTFLAIILGTASAGLLAKLAGPPDASLAEKAGQLWIGSLVCVGIAAVGTVTSLWIRRPPAAQPDLRFRLSSLAVPPDTRAMLRHDRPLLMALLASCMFWLVSGIAIQAVNSLGLVQLQLGELRTSLMTASIGLGIAVGAVIAGRLSHGRADFRLVRIGLWGIVLWLLVMSVSLPGGRHLLGFAGSFPVLILLGVSAGFFAIPVQVFLQTRPPDEQKGRMIAVMNQANFLAILISGMLYSVFDRMIVALDWPRSPVFAMMAVLLLPVAWLYRPRHDADSPSTVVNSA